MAPPFEPLAGGFATRFKPPRPLFSSSSSRQIPCCLEVNHSTLPAAFAGYKLPVAASGVLAAAAAVAETGKILISRFVAAHIHIGARSLCKIGRLRAVCRFASACK